MAEMVVKKSSPLLIVAAWLVVVIPAGWGLTYTVQDAMKIFTTAPTAGTAPTPAPIPAK